MRVSLIYIFVSISLFFNLQALGQSRMAGRVVDAENEEPVIGAYVFTSNVRKWALTDTTGKFSIDMQGDTRITISSMGYKSLQTSAINGKIYKLYRETFRIKDVIVTAVEAHDLTGTSKIGRDAISHIQPSSFADLWELLPGSRSIDPSFGSPQVANLRAAGGLTDNHKTSALGTKFLIDGMPINNNANLQYTPAFSQYGSDFVNAGTDMRTISTEDIESVDIIRGIPSAEYGDLTSGLIKIKRKKGGKDLRMRFKADMKSKLFYVGKGMEFGSTDKLLMNAGLNYLDSRVDPRNLRQNYKRLTATYRISKTWSKSEQFRYTLNWSADYNGSFDDEKADKDLDNSNGKPIETYKSSYNKFSTGSDFTIASKRDKSFFRSAILRASFAYENDLIDRWRFVSNGASFPLSIATTPGEHDAVIIPAKYESTMKIDGKPFYGNASAIITFNKRTKAAKHKLRTGIEWNMEKNFGKGVITDPLKPFNIKYSTRTRTYDAIPATHRLNAFAEYNPTINFGSFVLEGLAGIRLTSMFNMGKAYSIQGKAYAEPRLNTRISFPKFKLYGIDFKSAVFGGFGIHTKFPTLDQLFPENVYEDITQLNYWPVEEKFRRVNVMVFKIDPTNYSLEPAQNMKFEIGTDFIWNGFSLSLDYFIENMTSGFRTSSNFRQIRYKDYDESAIDHNTLTGSPQIEHLPYTEEKTLTSYGYVSNGSRSFKQGVEFTFSSKRIININTKITINGAWFRTRYSNSQPQYYKPSISIGGKDYPYIGLYKENDGMLYESLNTNFMFDTQIPDLGLIFSTSFQCLWFTGKQRLKLSDKPISYLDKNKALHPFTEKDEKDGVLSALVRKYTDDLFEYESDPFSMGINLKITKKLYQDRATCSLFVNRLLNIAPNYIRKGVVVRRNSIPYFGMELEFKF